MKTTLAVLLKLGGAAAAAYGVNIHSWRDMTLGATFTAAVHFIDSVWNSPKGTPA